MLRPLQPGASTPLLERPRSGGAGKIRRASGVVSFRPEDQLRLSFENSENRGHSQGGGGRSRQNVPTTAVTGPKRGADIADVTDDCGNVDIGGNGDGHGEDAAALLEQEVNKTQRLLAGA